MKIIAVVLDLAMTLVIQSIILAAAVAIHTALFIAIIWLLAIVTRTNIHFNPLYIVLTICAIDAFIMHLIKDSK